MLLTRNEHVQQQTELKAKYEKYRKTQIDIPRMNQKQNNTRKDSQTGRQTKVDNR